MLHNSGSIAVDLQYLTVYLFQFLGIVVLLVVACGRLLTHVAADRTQDLDVLVALARFTHLLRVIEADNYQGNVIG